MATATQRLEVTLDTALESADVAEDIVKRVAEAAGFGEEDVHKFTMAVREGVINAYNYGNLRNPDKKITIAVEFEPVKMIVHILDEGCGFEPADIPDPLAEENLLRTSGRGLFLMRAFMDELTIQRGPGGGTDLMLAKRLPPRVSDNGRPPTGVESFPEVSVSLQGTCREVGDVTVIDFSGRITLGEASATLRRMVRELVERGRRNILLNLEDVDYIDSSGIGELVGAHTAAHGAGGELKLVNLNRRVNDLLQITRLYTVFDIQPDESAALRSFRAPAPN